MTKHKLGKHSENKLDNPRTMDTLSDDDVEVNENTHRRKKADNGKTKSYGGRTQSDGGRTQSYGGRTQSDGGSTQYEDAEHKPNPVEGVPEDDANLGWRKFKEMLPSLLFVWCFLLSVMVAFPYQTYTLCEACNVPTSNIDISSLSSEKLGKFVEKLIKHDSFIQQSKGKTYNTGEELETLLTQLIKHDSFKVKVESISQQTTRQDTDIAETRTWKKWFDTIRSVFDEVSWKTALESVRDRHSDFHLLRQHENKLMEVNTAVGDLKTSVQQNLQTLGKHATKLDKANHDISTNKRDQDLLWDENKNNQKTVDDKFPRIESKIMEVNTLAGHVDEQARRNQLGLEKLNELTKSELDRHEKEHSKRHKAVETKLDKLQFGGSVTEAELNEMKEKGISLYVLIFLIMILIGSNLLLWARQTQLNQMRVTGSSLPQSKTATGTRREQHQRNAHLLKWTRPVEAAVCVVVFHTDTERKHAAETRSVFEEVGQAPPAIHSRVVRGHSDIEDLPGCLVYLVFVDFNERNVILEDPKKGLGDLRVTTVRSLWSFGADVTVIYCQDHRSRQLGEGDLFNRDLASVYSQTELVELKNQDRILSIFDKFSDFQKLHCRKFIIGLLQGRST